MILFGLCNCVTLWCAGWTIYLALPHTVAGWEDFPKLVETNKTLQELVISIAATYGLYFFASFLHFEPWHMVSPLRFLLFMIVLTLGPVHVLHPVLVLASVLYVTLPQSM